MNTRTWSLLFLTAAFSLGLASEGRAGRRGFFLITWGDHVAELEGASPTIGSSVDGEVVPANLKLGYYYEHVGVFWLNLWTWNGTYCLVAGDSYFPLEEKDARAMMAGKELPPPPWTYRYPPLLGVLIAGGLVVLAMRFFARGPAPINSRRLQRLREDARFQRALGLFEQQRGGAEDEERIEAAFEAAVASLVEQGVTDPAARSGLALLLENPGA